MDQGVDNNVIENSLVSSCDFPVVRKVEKFVGEEACVQALLENMEDAKSLGLVADEDPSYGRKTPHGSFFDPFATRPEELACAPKKKVISATEVASQRRLSFELGDYPIKRLSYEFDDSEEDDQFLEWICKMFIDLIISKQALETTGKVKPSICRKLNFDLVFPRGLLAEENK